MKKPHRSIEIDNGRHKRSRAISAYTRKKAGIAALVIAIGMVFSLVMSQFFIGDNNDVENDDSKPALIQHTAHGIIYINNDTDFITQAWPGAGIESDPFVISDYEINAASTSKLCISIRNTTSHFLVDDNYLHHTLTNWDRAAIYLNNVTNGTVSNNIVKYSTLGILVAFSEDVVVSGNNCSSEAEGVGTVAYGIYLRSTENVSLLNNTCMFNVVAGLYLRSANESVISENSCLTSQQSGMFLRGSNDNEIFNNNISDNWGHGIFADVDPSYRNNITNNFFYVNDGYAIRFNTATYNRVWNNTFHHNGASDDTYDPANLQAYDDFGNINWWNTSGTPHGFGNYWSDLTAPDNNFDGIVDWSYNLTGGAKDYYPPDDASPADT